MNFEDLRIGVGHDTHRLGPGGPLIVGGIEINHDKHLIGHSDADVLLHAITDAILGGSGNEDIGQLFPDTAEENKDKDSAVMLQAAHKLVVSAGFRLINLDCVLFAQKPKISPHKQAMKNRISEILNLPIDRINIKAKTGEAVGPVGNEEAMMAQCTCLMYKETSGNAK